MNKSRILVVEDEEIMADQLRSMLSEQGYDVEIASDGQNALEKLQGDESLIITDMKMPVMDGMELLKELKARRVKAPVIMITAYGSVQSAVEAMKAGATDYITKPYDHDEIFKKVRKIVTHQRILEENIRLKNQIEKRYELKRIIGESKKIQDIANLLKQVAPTPSSVLIEGPSGTGKELIAQAIHYMSDRRYESFIVVNCAAIPETLLEAELFGYKKGSFTDAKADKKGCFEEAHGGTIFLDEIGDMSLALQAKMLRVLQEKEFTKIGETKSRKVDVRVVSATNKNLKEEIKNGNFREDLYFRLNVITISVPPLTERIEDIPLLVNHFIKNFNHQIGRRVKRISDDAMEMLMEHNWPGNIRELENMIERAMIMTHGEIIQPEVIKQSIERAISNKKPEKGEVFDYRKQVEDFEKNLIEEAINKANGKMSKASKILGISRHALRYQMMKLGMSVEDED